jgi:fermentation-respiration switch protein FrsA (DUF1100 family)
VNEKTSIFGAVATKKIIKRMLLILALLASLVIVSSGLFYLFPEKFIFQPKMLAVSHIFQFDQPFEEYFIKTPDGETLNALFFKSPTPSKGFILYFHGNSGNLQRWGKYAIDFTQLGYDILMVEYRGYGKSTGRPSEVDFYADAQVVLDWAKENIPFSHLIIYGRSLGSGVATHLAIKNSPDLLILETPFNELKGVINTPLQPILFLFPARYHFPNDKNIPLIKCKKVIFHGTLDWVVPLSSALKLKPLLSENDRFFIIQGGGHRNLNTFKEFRKGLAEVLN